MPTFRTIITTAGAARFANAVATQTPLALTHVAVGDGAGSAVTPTAGMTALVREVWRAPLVNLSRAAEAPTQIIAEFVVPSSVGGWTVRECALFAADGTMVAIGNLADTYKPTDVEGSAREMVVRMYIEVADAGAVSLVVNTALVTATQSWASTAFLAKSQNLADIPDKAAARANLGVISAVLQAMYPVGEYYATARDGNPSALLGFGTWVRWAEGRTLFGVNPADASMNAPGMTGGAAAVTLGSANIPAHTHSVAAQLIGTDSAGAHTHTVNPPATTTTTAGAHSHAYGDVYFTENTNQASGLGVSTVAIPGARGSGSTDSDNAGWLRPNTVTESAGDHAHAVDIAAFASDSAGAHSHTLTVPAQTTGSTGSGTPFAILPPYMAVNIWRRTA